MADESANDYEVGYGKPPKSRQYKKGKSGNPSGRPSGSKNLKTDIEDVLAETIPVKEGGRSKRVSKQRAVVMALVVKAMKGDVRAVNALFSMMLRLLPQEEVMEGLSALGADDAAILEAFAKQVLANNTSQETDDES